MNLDIYLKGYGFLYFAKDMTKNLSNKYSTAHATNGAQKLLDSAKTSGADAIKTASKKAVQKSAEATGDLIVNEIADKITSASKDLHSKKSSKESHLEKRGSNNEIPKERYISPEKRQIIDEFVRQCIKLTIKV